jgi:carbon storage regulator
MHSVLGKESAMLVLSRHLGEKILIPGLGITIMVVAIRGNVVRLGIDAPPDVKVFREEIAPGFQEPAPSRRSRDAALCCV